VASLNAIPKAVPMKISLTSAGKRYNRDWIFRNCSYQFITGNSYAITGPNGSGKSTLLQSIGGAIVLSEGQVHWHSATNNTTAEIAHTQIAIAAPYLEVIEEMTVAEFLQFHQQFKPLLSGITIPFIIDKIGLASASEKQIRYYSSGMKQRVKLAQAIFSEVPVLLLDEPCTNLDAAGIELYQRLVNEYCQQKLVIVSSNDIAEYGFCTHQVKITDYKS
jgi:ABC-type multidrug transport system ATPase subunit